MKSQSAGFYADSLEMLLDTMCNMLGGIVFIALMVALCAGETTAPTPASYAAQTRELSNDLAAVTVSNTLIASEIRGVLQHLQEPRPQPQNIAMHLPAIAPNTTRQQWMVIVRYGKLYPLGNSFHRMAGVCRFATTGRWRFIPAASLSRGPVRARTRKAASPGCHRPSRPPPKQTTISLSGFMKIPSTPLRAPARPR